MRRAMAGAATAMLALAMTVKVGHAMIVAEEYGWYSAPPEYSAGEFVTADPDCGTGRRLVCESKATQQCVTWQSTGATLGGSMTSISVGVSTTCATMVTTTTYKYYP